MSRAETANAEWLPIATAEQGARAQVATASIAAGVLKAIESDHVQLGGIVDGLAGFALLFEYRAECLSDEAVLETAARIATRAAQTADRRALEGLHRGLPGIVWTLRAVFGSAEDGDELDASLEAVFTAAATEILDRMARTTEMDVGLGNGLAGVGLFALDAAPPTHRPQIVDAVIDRLSSSATRDESGARWITPPSRMPAWHRGRSDGYVDLGLATGLPGVCYFLAQAIGADVCADRAAELLEQCWRWLFSRAPAAGRRWSDTVPPLGGAELGAPRAAWCRGDFGVGAATLAAATAVDDHKIAEAALSILREAASSQPSSWRVGDACLCHGWAGLLQICNRLYQATRDEIFSERARFCLEETLRQCEREGGLQFDYELGPRQSVDVLVGASGVALALHAATTDVEPIWDRCLAIDVVPGAGP